MFMFIFEITAYFYYFTQEPLALRNLFTAHGLIVYFMRQTDVKGIILLTFVDNFHENVAVVCTRNAREKG